MACTVDIPGSSPPVATPVHRAIGLIRDLRRLEPSCAMADGRKWSSVPFILIATSRTLGDYAIPDPVDAILTVLRPEDGNLGEIRQAVSHYRRQLLDELDNLGLLVTYDRGRYRVGPALTPHRRLIEGHFYYGPADQRKTTRGKYYTVDRDAFGIEYEIEQFEALLNNPDVRELDLQRFFEDNPHFLVTTRLMQPLPQVRLVSESGRVLIPDFVLKPIVAIQRRRDSNWEVLDLKHPQSKLLAGPSDHRRFSQEVMQAVTQVKDYKDYFETSSHAAAVTSLLGQPLRHPRLGVLIGRMPDPTEIELLEKLQAREPGVRVVTYDEILEAQKGLLG
jgi:hypothetical protein